MSRGIGHAVAWSVAIFGGTRYLNIFLWADQAGARVGERQLRGGYVVGAGARGTERPNVLAAILRLTLPLAKRYTRVTKSARNVGNWGMCKGTQVHVEGGEGK